MSAFALKDLEFQFHDRWRNRFGGWPGRYPSVGEFLCRCKHRRIGCHNRNDFGHGSRIFGRGHALRCDPANYFRQERRAVIA